MQKNTQKCRKIRKNAEKICTYKKEVLPLQRETKNNNLTTDRRAEK